ncbi:MAG: heparan-alpha-glucosaminide N-acetyltransferase domain-containing protein [Pedococcus sp.]
MSQAVLPEVAPGRIVGVDVARALALVGMMATHMLPGIDGTHVPWPQQVAGGRASALFAVLAGVSMALVSGRTTPLRGRARYAASARLVVRAVLIGTLGLVLGLVPSGIAVILAFYAVLFLLGLPFLGLRAPALAALAVLWAVAVPAVSLVLRPHLPEHVVGSPTPAALMSPGLLLNELLLVGYYPAVVWLAYLFAGLAMGRIDLRRKGVDLWLLVGGVLIAVLATAVSRFLLARADAAAALASTYPDRSIGSDPAALHAVLTHGLHGTTPTGSWWWLATVAPHSGTPLDLAQTIGSAMAALGLCLLVTRFQPRVWAAAFGAGAMTLSLYTLHVVIMGRGWWPDLETPNHYDDQVLLILGIGAVLALIPVRGPLETVVAVLSRSASAAFGQPANGYSQAAYRRPRG